MLHPHTELRPVNEEVGLGVFATRRIPKGTIVWALDSLDQRLAPEQVTRLGSAYVKLIEHYAYPNARGEWVLCWDMARWINHACSPTSLSTGWDFDLALRDLEPGDQLTTDYASLNLDTSFRCACGEPGCRGRIVPSDFERMAAGWDELVRSAAAEAGSVDQPLWKWVAQKSAVRAAFANPAKVPSILAHKLVSPRPAPIRRRAAAAAPSQA